MKDFTSLQTADHPERDSHGSLNYRRHVEE